ncbi:MAG: lyase family protein [Gammaproteobacteria bacterium]|nr:lyase family protein [Gammaproteobacteria bacterium]
MKTNGRLKKALDPAAHAIVFPLKSEEALLKEFTTLATLNEAHLVSLHTTKLLDSEKIKTLLKTIQSFRQEHFAALLKKQSQRGAYLLFENHLIDTLGMDIAGSIHIARSRNDMNATTFKLNLRKSFFTIYKNLTKLRDTLLKQAKKYQNVAMPIYSQYQVAQVGTYAYYLLAIEEALARDQMYLKNLYSSSLDECPIGAAAGCGSSFVNDSELTASLLGFTKCCNNALDAVASRDLALRMFSGVSIMTTTLSRIAQDLQVWTTQEFNFFELPDEICGGSSMMPQKKNPYLLEVIKGKAASLNGLLTQALTAMHNVPFSNSVEVGTEALQNFESILKNAADALTLTELFLRQAVPIENNMRNSISKGLAFSTGLAETLVKEEDISFREAYQKIGETIADAMDKKSDPVSAIFKLTNQNLENKDAIHWAHINEFGGGPGKQIIQASLEQAKKRLQADSAWMDKTEAT